MSTRPDAEARRARRAAREIIAHHLGEGTHRVCARSGGATNHVYEVVHPEGAFIVRLSLDPAKIHDFQKEQWAIARARDAGVPVPEVLEVGNQPGPFIYMVAKLARGEEATNHPQRLEVLEQLGVLAARVHGVETHGYGSTFDWSQNQLSRCETWDDYLDRELGLETRLETLAKHGGIENGRLRRMRARLGEIAPHLKALNLLNYAPYLQRAAEAGDAVQLERCRIRLSGALDLYSL